MRLSGAGGHVFVPMVITATIAAFTDISMAPPTLVVFQMDKTMRPSILPSRILSKMALMLSRDSMLK